MVGMGSVSSRRNTSLPFLPKAAALGLGEGAHLADVSPRHEGFLPGAGDDQYTDLLVGLHGVQQLRQIRQHLRIQGVQRLRTVDGGHGIRTFFSNSTFVTMVPPYCGSRRRSSGSVMGKKRFLQGVFHPQNAPSHIPYPL